MRDMIRKLPKSVKMITQVDEALGQSFEKTSVTERNIESENLLGLFSC